MEFSQHPTKSTREKCRLINRSVRNNWRSHLRWRQTQPVAVSVEKHALVLSLGALERLDPLAPTRTLPHALDETPAATIDVGAVVLAHDRFDGLGSLVGVVEGDGADVVVEDVGLDDAVQELAADEAKFTVDRGGGAAGVVPGGGLVVGKRWIGVLEEGDGD